ncbi:membrane protein insertion efficiency factor YidD [Micromonospora sp. SL4-19]|uniref:membrane protein insertion efficiency factor YidD n=1 Tax=Micromonospora sp. SL4-19 TaxID=3399129 RepID=UPI003A4DACB0
MTAPALPGSPTCSAYGLAAVKKYGLAVGGRMAADRVARRKPHVPRGTPAIRCADRPPADYSGRWQTASTLLPSGSRTNAPK